MLWHPVPTAVGRQIADLVADLLPEIERDAALLHRYARSANLRRVVFPEARRHGRRTYRLFCRPFSYDLGVLEEIWDDGVYSQRVPLAPGDVVIDVGGRRGFFSVLAGARVGPRGRILALEPAQENLALLRENLRRNRLRNVTVVPAAAAARAGRAPLHLAPASLDTAW